MPKWKKDKVKSNIVEFRDNAYVCRTTTTRPVLKNLGISNLVRAVVRKNRVEGE